MLTTSHHHVDQGFLIKEAALHRVASCLANSHMDHLCSRSSKQLQVKANTISKCFKRAGFVYNAEFLEDDEQGDTVADEAHNVDV
ncbi:hypothetical protein HPB50_007876 [Hyalomma asiaticum]|uniref:Uncharacterized protein n=1 Tax=Hyalomma asiaticum TaxID=266040 RepID=A0ACB7TIY3_HYAAI|nr:hypothetical protein HPB50_007876 [Hyalomma asiaticum]